MGQSDTSHFQFISSAFSWRRKEGCRATFATPSPPLLPPLAQRDTSIPYHRLSILHRNRSRTRIRHDDIKLLEFIYVVDSRASLRVSLPPLPRTSPRSIRFASERLLWCSRSNFLEPSSYIRQTCLTIDARLFMFVKVEILCSEIISRIKPSIFYIRFDEFDSYFSIIVI